MPNQQPNIAKPPASTRDKKKKKFKNVLTGCPCCLSVSWAAPCLKPCRWLRWGSSNQTERQRGPGVLPLMHLLPLMGGIYFSKVTKRNVPKTQFEVGRTSMLNYVLHIGTRALWNRFHNRHLKNQTICNWRTNSQRIFMWIQNDTLCLCRDLNNTLGIFF